MGLFDRIKKSLLGEDEIKQQVTAQLENSLKEQVASESNEDKNDAAATTETETKSEVTEPEVKTVAESETETEVFTNAADQVEVETEKQAVVTEDFTVTPGSETNAVKPEPVVTEAVEEESVDDTIDVTDNESEVAETDMLETTDDVYEKGLTKTNQSFGSRLNAFFSRFRSVDENFFEELEELLLESDVGFETTMQLTESLKDEVRLQNAKTKEEMRYVIVEKMVDLYEQGGLDKNEKLSYDPDHKPNVYLFVGVNGAGKTTTVGKLAARLKQGNKKVMLVAADTFRAGAVAQLVEWGKRVDVPVVTGVENADPASVVFDGVQKAMTEQVDYLLIDTAGRLQNKVNLMNELDKINRTIKKLLPEQPQEVLLVIDGSTGQNALIQAKEFNETTKLTGLVLTKIDGSSKGGIVLSIRSEMSLPVKLVGLGEKTTDLAEFDAEKFAKGLFKNLI